MLRPFIFIFSRCEWHSAKMWLSASKILVICLFIQSSHAYSMGAPDNACRGMTPGKKNEIIWRWTKFNLWSSWHYNTILIAMHDSYFKLVTVVLLFACSKYTVFENHHFWLIWNHAKIIFFLKIKNIFINQIFGTKLQFWRFWIFLLIFVDVVTFLTLYYSKNQWSML